MHRSFPLIATLAVEAGAVLVLYRFLQEPGLAIPIAFGCAAWLLGTTVFYLGARLAQVPAAVRAVGCVTLPALRRRVDRAVAATILTGVLVATGSPALAAADPVPSPVATAAAAEPEPTPEVPSVPSGSETPPETAPPILETTHATGLIVRSGRAGDPAAVVAESTTPGRTGTSAPKSKAAAAKPKPTPEPTPHPSVAATAPSTPATPTPAAGARPTAGSSTAAPTSYTVVRGDSFWEIAARTVAAGTRRDRGALPAAEITAYWVQLCDMNRERIQSGDVNLIYTGEVVELPAI